jgi:uncharacterized protein (TIGR03435 family)
VVQVSVGDFELNWTPDFDAPAAGTPDAAAGISVFAAVQDDLGLRLQSK